MPESESRRIEHGGNGTPIDRPATPAGKPIEGISPVGGADFPEGFVEELQNLSQTAAEPQQNLQPITAIADSVDNAIDSAVGAIAADITSAINSVDAVLASCRACVIGEIGVGADKIDRVISKCCGKIDKQIFNHLDATYQYSAPYLGPPPDMETVVNRILGKQGRLLPIPPDQFPQAQTCKRYLWWVIASNDHTVCNVSKTCEGDPEPTILPGSGQSLNGPFDSESAANQWAAGVCRSAQEQDSGACAYIPPPAPEPPAPEPCKPTCPPPPDIACPTGYEWKWDIKACAYRCTRIVDLGGSEPTGTGGTGGQGSAAAICDVGEEGFCDPTKAENWSTSTMQCMADGLRKWLMRAGVDCDNVGASSPAAGDLLKPGGGLIFLNWLGSAFLCIVATAIDKIGATIKIGKCNGPMYTAYFGIRSLLGFCQRWLGLELGPGDESLRQGHNFSCPTGVTSLEETDLLYLRGLINDKAHENISALNNRCSEYSRLLRKAKRTRFSPAELLKLTYLRELAPADFDHQIRELGFTDKDDPKLVRQALRVMLTPIDYARLWLRKEISDTDLSEQLGALGITSATDQLAIKTLAKWIPTPSDIIPLMVRDAFDDNLAVKYQYDLDFDKKFTGKALEWAAANGVDASTMKHFWRSHWRNPSYTFLAEALHRCRADSADPQARANAITVDDVREFLKIDDHQPWWIDKQIAISYRPLRLIDLRQAYDIAGLDRPTIVSGLKDLGYSEWGVDRILELWEARRRQRLRTTTSGLTPRNTIKFLRERLIDEDTARDLMARAGVNKEQGEELIADALTHRELQERKLRINWIHKRYKVGDIGPEYLVRELSSAGLDINNANLLAVQWETELQYRGKEIAASVLCKWYSRGLIDATTYAIRLRRVGYSAEDTRRIIQACQLDIDERKLKAAERAAKEAQKEREKCMTREQKCGTNGKVK